MGKVRVNTIGDEALEAKQKEEAVKRKEAKKATKAQAETSEEIKSEVKKEKKIIKKQGAKKIRTARYAENKKLVEKTKHYSLPEALDLLLKMRKAGFDETVELHINAIEKLSGNITLPHGTGKQTKVAIFSPSKDATGSEKLLKDIEAGKIDFDVLVATPDAMPKLAKVARILGPRGLMPNPKTGTVTQNPEEVAKKYAGGQMGYKTEIKAPVLHVTVGKLSFGKEKLADNIKAFVDALDSEKVKSVFLKSTMSPSVKLVK